MLNEDEAVLSAPAPGPIPVIATDGKAGKRTVRLYSLDWVKAGCIALLIPYHTALIFATYFPYHIKSKETSIVFTIFNLVIVCWYVVALMLIAGYGANKALERRTAEQFITERLKRLLLPLVFGTFVIVYPQVYIERLYNGQIHYSYLEFYTHIFDGIYPNGNLSWHHLWYIAYLFVISVVLLPLCLRIRKWSATPGTSRLMALLSTKYGSLLLVVPLLILEYALRIYYPSRLDLIHDWVNVLTMSIYYLYGFMLAGNEKLFNAYVSTRRICLFIAASIITLYFALVLTKTFDPNTLSVSGQRLLQALRGLVGWCCATAIIGYAVKYLNVNNGLLKYASKAFLPVYILHQTILLILAYYVLPMQASMMEKFVGLMVLTYLLSIGIYELFIRRIKWVGLLFGV